MVLKRSTRQLARQRADNVQADPASPLVAPLRPLANLILHASLPATLLLGAGAVWAGPQGGQVVGGKGTIAAPNANTTVINQSSNHLVVDWTSFNVKANELVKFNQPSVSASALNHIFDQNPSQIFGTIRANGQVILVNPNGVFFGPTAKVSVGSLVASGLGVNKDDFMASGKINFEALPGQEGGMVVNQGLIEAATGGSVTMVGGAVSNEGVILATAGQVTLAAGRKATMDFDGDGLIQFVVDEEVLENAHSLDDAVSNSGEIHADGGMVLLTGKAAQDVFSNVVNNEGVIRAGRIDNVGGVIKLVANGTSNSLINTGTLDVSGDGGNGGRIKLESTGTTLVAGESVMDAASDSGNGGRIKILGDLVGLLDVATVDASGATGGGTILVGGDYQGSNPNIQNASATYVGPDTTIKADAITDGDGGRVIVWADDATRVHGSISARGGSESGNGGFIETSGAYLDVTDIQIDATAAAGQGGEWLLDPNNITIQAAGSDTNVSGSPNFTTTNDSAILLTGTIQGQLNVGTSVTVTTGVAGTNLQAGDITVADDITKSSGGNASLTLAAHNTITLNSNANITSSSGTLAVTLNSDRDNSDAGAIVMNSGSSIVSNGGDIVLGGGLDPLTDSAVGEAANPSGVLITGATLNSSGGDISILGQGQITGAGATDTAGVVISNKAATATLVTSGSGNIIITGTGGAGGATTAAGSAGVIIHGGESGIASTATVSSSGGNITIDGTSGTLEASSGGAVIQNGGRVTASGAAGDITITGSSSHGGAVQVAAGCAVCVSPTFVQNTATNGDIQITGTNTNSSALITNIGVAIQVAGSFVETTGGGTLQITGTGGAGGAGIGVQSARVTSSTGDITLIGTGTSGAGNSGLSLDTEQAISGVGVIESTGSANIFITATAASGGTGIISRDTQGGSPTVNRIGNSAMTGDITLTTDTMDITTTMTITGQGNLYIEPENTGTSIGLAGGSGTLNLTTTELGKIQNGFDSITIGRDDGTGTLTFGSGGVGFTFDDQISLQSGGTAGTVTINGTLGTSVANDGISVLAGGNVNLSDNAISSSGGVTVVGDNIVDSTVGNTLANITAPTGDFIWLGSLTGSIGTAVESIDVAGLGNLFIDAAGTFNIAGIGAPTLTDLSIVVHTAGTSTFNLSGFSGLTLGSTGLTDSGANLVVDGIVSTTALNISIESATGNMNLGEALAAVGGAIRLNGGGDITLTADTGSILDAATTADTPATEFNLRTGSTNTITLNAPNGTVGAAGNGDIDVFGTGNFAVNATFSNVSSDTTPSFLSLTGDPVNDDLDINIVAGTLTVDIDETCSAGNSCINIVDNGGSVFDFDYTGTTGDILILDDAIKNIGAGDVTLTTVAGGIFDFNNTSTAEITTDGLVTLVASGAVGTSGNPLDIKKNSTGISVAPQVIGQLFLDSIGALTIDDPNSIGLTIGGGRVRATSPLVINADATITADMVFTASNGATDGGDDLTVTNEATLTLDNATTAIKLTLEAGDSIIFDNAAAAAVDISANASQENHVVVLSANLDGAPGPGDLEVGSITQTTAAVTTIANTGDGLLALKILGATVGALATPIKVDVDTFASNTTDALFLQDTDGLDINTVDTTIGITTSSDNVRITTGTTLAINDDINLVAGTITLNAGGAVTQGAIDTIIAAGLELLGTGPYTLTDSGNDVDSLAGNVTGAISFRDTDNFTLTTVGANSDLTSGGNITLNAGSGTVTQDANGEIFASGLELLGAGAYTLTQTGNNVATLAASTTGSINYNDANALTVGTVNTAGITTAASTTDGVASGSVTLSTTAGGAGAINITNNVTTGNASVTDVTAAANSAASGSISITADMGITGIGRLITGNADITANQVVDVGDSAASGTITLNVTGAGNVAMSGLNALTIGSATANDTLDTATTGNITIGNTNAPDSVNNGMPVIALDVSFGTATGGVTTTAGVLNVTTDGGVGDAGAIRITSGEALRVGALATAGTAQNVSISTTGGAALTITNATEVLTGDTVTFDAGTGILTMADTSFTIGAGTLTLVGDEINLTGGNDSINGAAGTITLRASTTSQNIEIAGGGATAGLDLTAAEIAAINDGFSSITIGDVTNGTGTVTVAGAISFDDNVTLVGGAIASNATLTSAANAVTFTARSTNITDGNGATSNVDASSLTASAVTGINIDTTIATLTSANVTGTGAIDISDTAGGMTVTSATTADGAITLNATGGDLTLTTVTATGTANITGTTTTSGNIVVGNVTAAGDNVSLTTAAGGAINEDGTADAAADITAATATLSSATGIGAAAQLEIDLTTLTSATVSGTGAINLSDTAGGLVVTTATTNDGAITLSAVGGNLVMTTVTATGTARNISASTTTGNIVVGNVTATGDDITLNAGGAIEEDGAADAAADITSGTATLTSANGVGDAAQLEVNLTTLTSASTTAAGADINISDTAGGLAVTSATTNDGAITFNATSGDLTLTTVTATGTARNVTATTTTSGNIVVGNVTAAGDNVSLTTAAGGAINEDGTADAAADITAATATLSSATGIGAAAQLEIDLTTLTSAMVSGTGAINLSDTAGGLVVTTATTNDGAITLNTVSGDLTLSTVTATGTARNITASTTTSGNIAVNGVMTATGDTVTFTAAGDVADGASGAIAAGTLVATLTGGTSDLTLNSGLHNIANLGAITAPGGFTLDNGTNSVTVTGAITTTDTAIIIDVGTGTYSQNDVDVSSGTGNITVTANAVALTAQASDTAFLTTGVLTLQPGATTTTMSVGGTTGTFSLTAAEVVDLAGGVTGAGSIIIGRSDHNAALDVDASVNFGSKTVTLQAGSFASTTGGTDNIIASILDLDARNGAIGTSADRIETQVVTLDASTSGLSAGGIFITEADDLILGNTRAIAPGAANLNIVVSAGGVITVDNFVTATGTGDITLTAGAKDGSNNFLIVTTNNVDGSFNQDISGDTVTINGPTPGTNNILLQDATTPDRRSRIVTVSGYSTNADNTLFQNNDTTNAPQLIAANQTYNVTAGATAALGDDAIFACPLCDVQLTDTQLNAATNITIDGLSGGDSGLFILDMIAAFSGGTLTISAGLTIDGDGAGTDDSFESAAGSLTISSKGNIGASSTLYFDVGTLTISGTTGGSITMVDTNTAADTTYNIGSTAAVGIVNISRGALATGDILITLIDAGTNAVTLTNSGGAINDKEDDTSTDIFGGTVTLTAKDEIGGNVAAGSTNDSLQALDVSATSLDVSTTDSLDADTHQIVLREANAVTLTAIDTAEDDITIVLAAAGALVVGNVVAGTTTQGAVTLTTSNGSITSSTVDGTADVIGTTINLTVAGAGSDIGSSLVNPLEIDAVTALNASTAGASGDDIFVRDTSGNLSIGTVNAGAGNAGLEAVIGAITDNDASGTNNITAALLTLDADDGIGTVADPLDITVTTLDADNFTLGDIVLTEANGLTVNNLSNSVLAGLITLVSNTGSIALKDGSVVSNNANVSLTASAGNITDADAGATAVNISTNNGNLSLSAKTNIGDITSFAAGTGEALEINLGAGTLTNASIVDAGGEIFLGVTGNLSAGAGAIVVGTGFDASVIVTATGDINVSAGGTIVLDGNDSLGLVAGTDGTGTLTIPDAGFNVGAGDLRLIGATDVLDTTDHDLGTFTADDFVFSSGGGATTLNTTVNSLTAHLITNAGALTVTEFDGITLTDVDTFNGGITVTAGGVVTVTDVASLTDSAANDISISTTAGDITVATVDAKALGAVTIVANTVAGQGILDDGAATVITGDVVTLTANDAVGETAGGGAIDTTAVSLDVSVTAAGLINLAETDAVTLTAIDTFNGAITLTTGGTTTVTNVTATSGAGADANDISITATAGDITVATVNNANALGDVTIVANTVAGQGILDDGAATVITGDVVTLTANDAVGETAGGGAIDTTAVSLDVSVTAAGLINLAETDAVTLTDVDTANGLITITAGGLLTATDVVSSTDNEANDISLTGVGIAVGVVTAGATVGDVTLAAGTGAITDAAADAATDVTAEVLTADATTGINLDTSATTLDVDNATSGNIDLDNSHTGSAITVLSLTNGGAGSIDLDQTGTDVTTDTLTISGAVISTGGGVVTIRTLTRGDIAVNSGITSSGGTINISSADDITLGAVTLDSDLTGSINLDVDNNITAAAQLDLGSGVLIGATIAFDGGTAGGDDTLIAQNLANTWVIGNTNNAGTLANSSIAPDASAAFTNFQNLTGNGDTDEFSFTGTGSISGAVDGQGSVDTLDYSALTAQISVVLTGGGLTDGFASTSGTSKVGSFDDINVVVGSSSLTNDDNLTSTVGLGTTATWDINGANQYSTGGDILDFSLMENLTGDNSADTFTVSVSHTGTLSGLDGNDTFNLTLTSVVSGDLLGGTGDDTFDFNDTARVIGTVVGGNLPGTPADEIDFFDSTLTVALAIVTTSASHGRTGTIENIAAGPDLITGGFSQIDNFVGSSDQIIGPDAETWWNITSTDSGTFGGSLGTITASTFNGFSILGGNKADYFIFQDTGDLGTIDGGINDPLIFNTLVGSLGGDTFDITGATSVTYTVIDGASVTHITTLSNIHNIDGTFATDADGPPPTGDTGNDIFNIDFSWGGDLIGVGGDDQFVFADGKTVGGTVDGGAGSDTVDWGAYTVSARNVVVTDLDNQGADGTEASITNGFTDIEILTGAGITGTGGDKLTNGTGITATTTVDWDISGVDSGTLDINGDVLTFNSFANLTGDAEDDNFIFSGGTLSGKVIGDAGTNTLDYSGAGATVAITLTALSATPANGFSGSAVHQSVATAFDHITVVVGSDLGDTLTGTDNAADWDIKDIGGSSDGIDDGTYDNSGTMLDFINIANLTGGAGIDTFVLDTSASLSGSIAGGADDDSITFGDGSSVGGSVDGGAGSDTLDFTDESVATSITLTAAGTSGLSGTSATNITVSFTDINVLVGNDDPLTELTGANLAATWNISDFDGVGLVSDGIDDGTYTVGTQSLKFVDFHNLTGGSSSDNFAFADSGSISGDVDGSGIADGDTVTGDANGNIFTIDSADTGTLTGKIGGTWSNVENLTGGAGADTFEFDASSSLSGNIDGAGDLDTLDWNTLGFGAPVTVTLTGLGTDGFAGTATGLPTGTFTNINTVLGDAGQSNLNSLIGQGADAEWDITSSDGGTYVSTNTLTWTNFGNLTGNSFDDEFEFDGGDLSGALDGGGGSGDLIIADDGGNAFVINGPDSGTLIGTITGGWSNIANLEGGAGVDTFTFITGGSLSGSMDGAGGTADVLTGDDDGNAFAITGAESGTLLPSIGGTWSNIENLVGGVGVDTVVFTTTGSVAGTVDGAGGSA
ncbi:MAG: hypothetical protein A3H91_15460, partial [Gammaproteobacteria bacterium RIFCSPLOWO2_02_FULL_61_13]